MLCSRTERLFMKIEIDRISLEENPDSLWHALAALHGLYSALLSFDQKTRESIRECSVFTQKAKEGDEIPWRMKIRITFNFSMMKVALWEISDHFYCVLNEYEALQLETETKKVAICYVLRLLREPMLIGKPETV